MGHLQPGGRGRERRLGHFGRSAFINVRKSGAFLAKGGMCVLSVQVNIHYHEREGGQAHHLADQGSLAANEVKYEV